MALKHVQSAQIVTFAATANPASDWAAWKGASTPWCTNGNYRLILAPGRYRVESPNGFELNTNGWAAQGKDTLVEHQDEAKIYANNEETGIFYITRLT